MGRSVQRNINAVLLFLSSEKALQLWTVYEMESPSNYEEVSSGRSLGKVTRERTVKV